MKKAQTSSEQFNEIPFFFSSEDIIHYNFSSYRSTTGCKILDIAISMIRVWGGWNTTSRWGTWRNVWKDWNSRISFRLVNNNSLNVADLVFVNRGVMETGHISIVSQIKWIAILGHRDVMIERYSVFIEMCNTNKALRQNCFTCGCHYLCSKLITNALGEVSFLLEKDHFNSN